MAKILLLPKDAVDFLSRKFANQHKAWLLGEGQWPMTVPLGLPTENDVAKDISGVREWVDAWESWSGQARVSRVSRQWARLGTQLLPASLEIDGPGDVATIIGQGQRWRNVAHRYECVTRHWPQLARNPVLGRHFGVLADYAEVDFARLIAMLEWLDKHPTSGLAPRQLPVPGLDTKWLEKRTGVITDLLKVIRSSDDAGDFYSVCGLRRPTPRIRVRILCPELRRKVGGLKDIEAPLTELAELSIEPQRAIIVENLETGLALPDIEATVAFMRLGNAVNLLAELPWLRNCRTVYWGDIDTHGYAILNRARRLFPDLQSMMMDQTTFLAYKDLWVEEKTPSPESELKLLDETEREVFEGLRTGTWGHTLRLEQERISWSDALTIIYCHFRPDVRPNLEFTGSTISITNKIDLGIALRKLHELAQGDGDLGYEYWNGISQLLTQAGSMQNEIDSLTRELEVCRAKLQSAQD